MGKLVVSTTERSVRRFLASSHVGVRRRFDAHMGKELSELILQLAQVGTALEGYEKKVKADPRSLQVLEFLFVAHYCLVTSSHLLISGLLVPAGNQMRLFGESMATALLCSSPNLPDFETYRNDPRRYPVQKAPDKLLQRRVVQALGLHRPTFTAFRKMLRSYNKFSHPTIVAEAAVVRFDGPARLSLTATFDEVKIPAYRKELQRRRRASALLASATTGIAERLSDDH